MKKILISVLIITLGLSAQTQTINDDLSKVTFKVSKFKSIKVEGSFQGMEGEIIFDQNDLNNASMNVCISAETVNTGNKTRDNHLRTADFLEIEKFPLICFRSEKIEKKEDGFIAIGNLTLHGVTKQIEIPFTYSENTFEGSFKINRQDYGVGSKRGFMVGEEIKLNIFCKLGNI